MKSEKQQTRPPASTKPQPENITFLYLGSCKMVNTVQHTVLSLMMVRCSAVAISSGLLQSETAAIGESMRGTWREDSFTGDPERYVK
jgi:hypothetical protein